MPLCLRKSLTLIIVATIALVGCAVERVRLTVDSTRIDRVSDHVLFGSMIRESAPTRLLDVLVFEVSSDGDISSIFENRQIQVRCKVDGKGESFGYGPFDGNINISAPRQNLAAVPNATPHRSDGRSVYTVYAFANLAATDLVDGQFIDTPLEIINFSELSCFVIGVAKAPVFFPRSNELTLTRSKFLDLVAEYRGQAVPPNKSLERTRYR